MKKKSKILTIVVSIIALVCLISGVSYAYIMLGVSQTTVNVIGTNCVKVSIEDVTDAITMEKAYPISDEEGEATDGYTFKITNTCNMAVDYSVNLDILNVRDGEKITPFGDIAIKLDDNEKAILGDLVSVEGTYQGDDYTVNDAKNLTSGTLAPNHSKTYTVRMWLDENASNESQSTNFYSKIAINGTPNNIVAVLPSKSEMYLTADNEEITDLTLTNNYVHHSQITLTCEGNDSTCYINTSKDIDFTGSILQVCGSNEPFEDCTPSGIFSGFSPNTWYQIDNVATIDSKDDETEEVIVRFTSCIGVVCSDETIVTLPKLDRTAPSINLLSTSANTNSAIVDVTASDEESGVSSITVKYGETEGTYTTEAEKTSNGYELKNLTNNKTYYYEITAIDKVGNKSTQTGSVRTNDISYPSVTYTAFDKSGNTLESPEYAYSAKVEVTFSDSLEHYIKVTDSVNLNALSTTTCGSGYIPTTCSEDATSTLQNGVWYKVSENKVIEFTSENTSNAKVVSITSDGRNYSDSREVTVAKIDRTNPSIQAGNVTTTSNSITIPLTTSDNGVISNVTCVYGTSTSYGNNGSANTGQCKLSGLTNGQTYYYKVTIIDTAGNSSEITGSASTGSITTPTVTMTGYNKAGSVISSEYFYKETAAISYTTTNVTSPVRFVKSSIAAASNVSSIEACGTGTNPGTCTSSVTTSFEANTWYKVGSDVTLTYETDSTSTGTVYALLYDGNNYSTSGTGNISKIDRTAPSVTLNSATLTTTSITVPITSSDSGSQLSSATCKYSDTNGSYTNTAATQSTSSCVMTGLTYNKTYYYQVVITDKLGNSTTKTGSAKTGTMSTPIISLTGYNLSGSSISAQNGYFYKEVATVNFSASGLTTVGYYIKSSQAATSSVNAYSCGNSTNPGSCSTSATTSLSAGYWYKVNNTSLTVIYQTATSATGTLNAVIYDGSTYSTTASGTISKIDRTSPTLTLGDSTSDATTITIPISTFSDTGAGPSSISSCVYGTSTSYGNNGTISGTSSCKLSGLTGLTTYYYQVCGIDKVGNQTCKTGSKATTNPGTDFKVGDYVQMTPSSTSYKPDSTLTGYTGSNQSALNPSELNLWRVIRINSDNTVDMVSQYVSSKTVYFYGATGYAKLVGTLNTIAKQYTNSSYTVRARHMGYSNQTENISSFTGTTAPATASTSSSTTTAEEKIGAGDMGYETDTGLVTTAIGNLIGYKVSATSMKASYWLASRIFSCLSSTNWNLRGRVVVTSGNVGSSRLVNYDSGSVSEGGAHAVRPIVTLKSGLLATGSGTSSDPYVLK